MGILNSLVYIDFVFMAIPLVMTVDEVKGWRCTCGGVVCCVVDMTVTLAAHAVVVIQAYPS